MVLFVFKSFWAVWSILAGVMFLQLNHLIINKLPPIGASQDILGNDVCQVLSRQGYTKNDRDQIWLK